MRTIRLLTPAALALSLLLLSAPGAWAGKEDVSDGKTPASKETSEDKDKPKSSVIRAVPLANPEGQAKKKPLICPPSDTAAVNTLEDLYGANGGELTELLKQVLARHQKTHGADGTETAQAPATEIQWQVTQPAKVAEKTPATDSKR